MSHFARVVGGIVTEVIVAEQDFIDAGHAGDPSEWVQCSYNTRNNVHYEANMNSTGREGLRGQFPGIGFVYDANLDVFYPSSKQFDSWILDTGSLRWIPPLPYPGGASGDGKYYEWNEENLNWEESSLPPDTP